MRIVGSLLLGITLAASTAAQSPIPTILLGERAIGAPATSEDPFPGVSTVASNGKDFLVATSRDNFAAGRSHGVMLVDSAGHPTLAASYVFRFATGDADGVASNGRDFLVVWGGLGGTNGVRVSAGGALLDSNPFVIHSPTRTRATSHDTFGRRSASWDGSQYVVLTTVERLVTNPLHTESSEIVTRVGADGQILQNDLEVNRGSNNALAARNGISVTVWSAGGVFVRTMNGGSLSDPVRISVASSTANAIAAGDDGFLVVWCDGGSTEVRAQHLDPGGRADAPPFTVSAVSTGAPAVTWDGTSYRIAWTNAAANTIQSVRVNATAVIDAPAVTLTDGRNPALAFNGASTLLVWSAPEGSTRARRADVAGAGQIVHRFFNPQGLNAIGFTSDGASVAWTEVTSRLTNVSDGTSSPPISDGVYTLIRGLDRPLIISGTAPPFTARYADGSGPLFALPTRNPFWIGNGFLSLWTDAAPGADPFAALSLYSQRFDANAHPIDGAPRQIGTSLSLSGAFIGSAALYNGVFVGASNTEVLVAYVDMGAALHGVLLKNDQIVDIGEIAPPQALANPISITSDGEDFLVTWISGMNGTNSYIGSRRVLANGDVPEPIRIDSLGNDTKDAMATFWTGQNYLVVWSKRISDGQQHELWALRIGRDGTLIDYPAQRIGTVNGGAPLWAYKDGLLAIAYQRDARVYWSFIVLPRRRAVAHL